jgi:aspartyl-tRNA(Asn)/glutamyl-tRNA(Gln) amidotransferase subunit C
MSLTAEDVAHVAGLARLGLTPGESERLREQLSSILGHIEALNRLETEDIAPTAQILPLQNVLREDVATPSLSPDEALANAPHTRDGFFAVQAVMTGAAEEQA